MGVSLYSVSYSAPTMNFYLLSRLHRFRRGCYVSLVYGQFPLGGHVVTGILDKLQRVAFCLAYFVICTLCNILRFNKCLTMKSMSFQFENVNTIDVV